MSKFVTLPVSKATIDLDIVGWICPAGSDKIGHFHVFFKVQTPAFPTLDGKDTEVLLKALGAEKLPEEPLVTA